MKNKIVCILSIINTTTLLASWELELQLDPASDVQVANVYFQYAGGANKF